MWALLCGTIKRDCFYFNLQMQKSELQLLQTLLSCMFFIAIYHSYKLACSIDFFKQS